MGQEYAIEKMYIHDQNLTAEQSNPHHNGLYIHLSCGVDQKVHCNASENEALKKVHVL